MTLTGKRPYMQNVGPAGGLGLNCGNQDVTGAVALYRAANPDRYSLIIYNNGTQIIYVGKDAGVTTANGMPVPVGSAFEIRHVNAVYAISASGTQDTRFWEETLA